MLPFQLKLIVTFILLHCFLWTKYVLHVCICNLPSLFYFADANQENKNSWELFPLDIEPQPQNFSETRAGCELRFAMSGCIFPSERVVFIWVLNESLTQKICVKICVLCCNVFSSLFFFLIQTSSGGECSWPQAPFRHFSMLSVSEPWLSYPPVIVI